jgi:hypothetical protein
MKTTVDETTFDTLKENIHDIIKNLNAKPYDGNGKIKTNYTLDNDQVIEQYIFKIYNV